MASLVLGTAQFGSSYGITNSVGRISDDEISGILATAGAAGVAAFDTAADYGDSQRRLGELTAGLLPHAFVTKFSFPHPPVAPTAENLYLDSMVQLGAGSLEGVLFHKVADFDDARALTAVQLLRTAREQGIVRHIGASIYDAADLDLALSVFPDLDLLQIPGSIVDRRLLDSAKIAELRRSGVTIHVRSALLQGLLLASAQALPHYFERLAPALSEIGRIASEADVSVLAVLLGFLRQHPMVDGVVFGATSVSELKQTLDAWSAPLTLPVGMNFNVEEQLLDPRRWPAVKVIN